MDAKSSRWKEVRASEYEWEQQALVWLRNVLPDHDPWRGWSNFEFISTEGNISEVDALVLGPKGLYLIEIKSWPGSLHGDAGTWVWTPPGRSARSIDNPRLLADRKAKRLKSLIRNQKAMRGKGIDDNFYVEAVVFLSDPSLDFQLDSSARHNVFLRDEHPAAQKDKSLAFGLMLNDSSDQRRRHDRVFAKAFSRALEEAGIKASVKRRMASDYVLGDLILEGPGFQDFIGKHTSLPKDSRRIRVFSAPSGGDASFRALVQRAARREYESLQGLRHPGILAATNYTETDLGPALIFAHDPEARRLDHFMKEEGARLGLGARLDLIRDIGEALRYAHGHKVYHRGISPVSVLVRLDENGRPQPTIFNWQTAARQIETTTRAGATLTNHLDSLIDSQGQVFMAPEAIRNPDSPGRDFDVFSLGALAFYILTGRPPASSRTELLAILEQHRGIPLAAQLDGASDALVAMVQEATHPEVGSRLAGIDDFLVYLDEAENELTDPNAERRVANPLAAKPGDILDGDFSVAKRLGSGATSIAFEVITREGDRAVLKLAAEARHNDTLDEEAAALEKLNHPGIVRLLGKVTITGLRGLVLSIAGEQTLAARLREEGLLDVATLGGLGTDLLKVVRYLEDIGVWHRDLKPENIGVAAPGPKDDRPHLVVFDFSLARMPADKIEAGTIAYLDPFLAKRKRKVYDDAAERYAAAAVLHEMALGALPRYGDGKSEPTLIDADVTIDAERFDPSIREGIADFFRRTLSRHLDQRPTSAGEMELEWTRIFAESIDPKTKKPAPSKSGREVVSATGGVTGTTSTQQAPLDSGELISAVTKKALEAASPTSETATLHLSARAINALHRADALKIRDLLALQPRVYLDQPGVGQKTRRELQALLKLVRARFAADADWTDEVAPAKGTTTTETDQPLGRSLDSLLPRLLPKADTKPGKTARAIITTLLGLDDSLEKTWPTGSGPLQSEVARHIGKTSARVSQLLVKHRELWAKDLGLMEVRDEIADEVARQGGVMTGFELARHLLGLRGSTKPEPFRSQASAAVLRAALEAESTAKNPRFAFRRGEAALLVAKTESQGSLDADELFAYAQALGAAADRLAALDPILSAQRAREELERVSRPGAFEPLSHERLLRLAAGASRKACVASTAEIYPRGLAVARALKLASSSLINPAAGGLDTERLEQRLRLRYPEMAELPPITELQRLLADAGLELVYDPDKRAFVHPTTRRSTTGSATSAAPRLSTQLGQPRHDSPEVTQAVALEEKLVAAQKGGGFLVLTTSPPLLLATERELSRRFDVRLRSLEAELIADMEKAALDNKIAWKTIIETDAGPKSAEDFSNLKRLAAAAFDQSLARWLAEAKEGETLLVSRTGLLARLDLVKEIEALADQVRKGSRRPHSFWLLLAATDQHAQPVLDSVTIPVIGRAEWLRVEESWVSNLHRAGLAAATHGADGKKESTE